MSRAQNVQVTTASRVTFSETYFFEALKSHDPVIQTQRFLYQMTATFMLYKMVISDFLFEELLWF